MSFASTSTHRPPIIRWLVVLVGYCLLGRSLRITVAVPHGGSVRGLGILGTQALAEAVAHLAGDGFTRRGLGPRAVRILRGREDHHVPRGEPADVEGDSRVALFIRAERDIQLRRTAAVIVGADDEYGGGSRLARGEVVGDRRIAKRQGLLRGVTPVFVVAVLVVGAQVDEVQGCARVGRHGVRPDRVRGPIRRRRQAHAAGRDLDLAFLARQVITVE